MVAIVLFAGDVAMTLQPRFWSHFAPDFTMWSSEESPSRAIIA